MHWIHPDHLPEMTSVVGCFLLNGEADGLILTDGTQIHCPPHKVGDVLAAVRPGALLAQPHVICVDRGQTYCNELPNDGGTVFMATRSTGQIQEGLPGFSRAAVDDCRVSWRFKPLDATWPFLLMTRPTDLRLATDAIQATDEASVARAKVLEDTPITTVEERVDDGAWMPMAPVPGVPALWEAQVPVGKSCMSMRAHEAAVRADKDRVEPSRQGWIAPKRHASGSDEDRVGPWLEKGILGTQPGANRNGRKW